MSARSTGMFSLMHRYCCFTREPQVCSRLKPMLDELSVAEYSFTGIDTSPKLSDSEAMERAAMSAPRIFATEGQISAIRRVVQLSGRRLWLESQHLHRRRHRL